jgi:multiple sugar transport system permease protein
MQTSGVRRGETQRDAVWYLHVQKAILYLLLSLGALVVVAPFLWMLISSVKTTNEIIRVPPTIIPENLIWTNYSDVFAHLPFSRYYLNTILIAVVSTLAVVFTSSLAGFFFAKYKFWGKEIIFYSIVATLIVPEAAIIVPLYVMLAKMGWINTYWALIVPHCMHGLGIFLMRQFIHNIPDDYIDAATLDGCNPFQIYARVILPLLSAPLGALAIFNWMFIWDLFLYPLTVVSSGNMFVLNVGLNNLAHGRVGHYNEIMAAATMAALPPLIIFIALQRQFVRGITLTGFK